MKSEWNIPDRFIPPPTQEEIEKARAEENTKPCPKCGCEFELYGPGGNLGMVWNGSQCNACGYEVIIDL